MSVEKLQKEIEKNQQLLGSLEQRGSQAQARANAAESKRRELASDALLEGRPVPEKDCERLENEAQKANREGSDCVSAARRVTEKLAELKRELQAAEREVLKNRIAEAISQRQKPLSQIDSAARSLPRAVAELESIDNSIGVLLAEISPMRFPHLIQSLKQGHRVSVRQYIENAFAGKLQDELAATQTQLSQRVVDALAGLPDGDEGDGLTRYRALASVQGLRAHLLKPGDEILAEPDEVKELVEQGALVAVNG